MKCPYCMKSEFVPEVVYRNCERYGSRRFNFRCLHCKKVVTIYAQRQVILVTPEKTDRKSDWE